jgi:hypothetical protein
MTPEIIPCYYCKKPSTHFYFLYHEGIGYKYAALTCGACHDCVLWSTEDWQEVTYDQFLMCQKMTREELYSVAQVMFR